MSTKTNIFAAAAIVATLAFPSLASAQAAIFLPSTYSWNPVEPTGIPGDARGSVEAPAHHRGPHAARPYGQW
jgi:hypothetical protein